MLTIGQEQVNQLNKNLHDNVAELRLANKELESFSYSVSHDLRAPLRAINSYAAIFQYEYAATLNEDAESLLSKIQKNAQKMGILIDDLLAFSKLGKKDVQKTEIDTKEMIDRIFLEINQLNPHKATIHIRKLPPSFADRSLIYQVWFNLVSNAIKYSEQKAKPEIEMGGSIDENSTTFYIKDNGAGFDIKYVNKLFGVFQRLHSSSEFEGTGIGLAIVHRIINKHGGRIWAEGKVNEGATFYFSLQKNDV